MNRKKWIGVLLVIAAILLAGSYTYFYLKQPEISAGHSEESKNVQEEPHAHNDKEEEEEWDGESVDLDIEYNEALGDCGLNEEVLALINQNTKDLADQMQMYLMSEFNIGNVQAVTWDGLVTIDYIGNNIMLTFDVAADETCAVQCYYSRNDNEWSFYKI